MLGGRSGFRAFWRLWWYKTGLIIEILSLFIHLQSCLGACWERLGSSTWEHPPWVPGSQSRVLSSWHTHGARTDSEHTSSVIHLHGWRVARAPMWRETRDAVRWSCCCLVLFVPPFLQCHYKGQLLATEEKKNTSMLKLGLTADVPSKYLPVTWHLWLNLKNKCFLSVWWNKSSSLSCLWDYLFKYTWKKALYTQNKIEAHNLISTINHMKTLNFVKQKNGKVVYGLELCVTSRKLQKPCTLCVCLTLPLSSGPRHLLLWHDKAICCRICCSHKT